MATVGEDEVEYESDPEEVMLPLAMRRREASDDEEGEGEDREKPLRFDSRVGIGSNDESDGQGEAPDYDEEESEIEQEEEEDELEEEEEEQEFEERVIGGEGESREVQVSAVVMEFDGDGQISGEGQTVYHRNNQAEEEKKVIEPFAVPSAGSFYMHDDRFRDNGGGRHRRSGGRKLWESKDDPKWGHDKFKEMSLQETHYEKFQERTSKGHYRGRGIDHGYVRGNRSRNHNNSNNQNRTSNGVRGRGRRRYVPPTDNNSQSMPTQNKQSGKSLETTSNTSSVREFTRTSSVQSDPVPHRKHVFESNLSSASPPFYPSGSSNQDISVTQKGDVQAGSTNRNLPPSVLMKENFCTPHSNTLLRGKTVADSTGPDRLYDDKSVRRLAGKPLTNLQLQSSGSSSIHTTQSPQSRAKGRDLAQPGHLTHQPTPSFNQVNRVSPQTQLPAVQQRPVQPYLRVSPQHFSQHPGSISQASSSPKAPSINSPGETESPPESSKSKTALVGKGKVSVQGSGRGFLLNNGAQVIGTNGSVAHGDQNFPGTPAFLPVMQFGGQHPGGGGVPAVGMALPGYVAQPQLGFGNSEMTWLPVLAGAAGALGATYCSSYIAVDSGYYARPSGHTPSLGISSKETSTDKPINIWKPPHRPELVNDEFGQRQNKPRRSFVISSFCSGTLWTCSLVWTAASAEMLQFVGKSEKFSGEYDGFLLLVGFFEACEKWKRAA
ncbi:hypothetical protein HHK36_021566 [Tetracentron sinense]|uniref:Btz domain-containing protein n=1 Tax=Tetracentron sinense TaxID=13715 RepID=A0A834YTB0_TETSI|nr:hypothetical protein HHK36_021566 [Tetracentron sinense]